MKKCKQCNKRIEKYADLHIWECCKTKLCAKCFNKKVDKGIKKALSGGLKGMDI